MGFFEDFIAGDAFFPVLIGLMLVLVLVFVWILLSGRKKVASQNNNETDASLQVDTEVISVEPTDIQENLENNANEVVSSSEKVEPILNDVVVNIPINNMDDTPVDLPIPEELNDVGEMIEVEKTVPLIENNVSDDEIVDIEMPLRKFDDVGETVSLPEVKSITTENVGEAIELPTSKEVLNEVGEEAVAFDTIPEADRTINESVEIEIPDDYLSEKTEIFDFPDFNNLEQTNDEKLTGNVEEDVIKAANDYISTVFKEN